MTRLIKTVGGTLTALALALAPGGTQAAVVLGGTPAGKPGEFVDLAIVATSETILESFDVSPDYESFANVLTLLSIEANPSATADGSGDCGEGACGFYYSSRKAFEQDTILVAFRFRVTDDAEHFVDVDGSRAYPLDLGVSVDGFIVDALSEQPFTVLAVPEPSTWVLAVAGFSLLIASRCRRVAFRPRAAPPNSEA